MIVVEGEDEATYLEERFGPISFIIAANDSEESVARAAGAARVKGAITAALYSVDESFIASAIDAYARPASLSPSNLTGGVYVNQSAAFSHYHVSGANPAGNACLTDAALSRAAPA